MPDTWLACVRKLRTIATRGLLIGVAGLAVGGPSSAADDPRAAVNYFIGEWSCAGTPWVFTPFLEDAGWIRNVYGKPGKPDGSAIVGYVAGLKKYVYRDFHADGSYADISSDGPVEGRWVWTGPYYPTSGGALNAQITYVIVNANRYERLFASVVDGKPQTMGHDACTKQP